MPLNLILTRDFRYPGDVFCLGVMQIADKALHTIERGWVPSDNGGRGGKRYESCIPAGIYRMVPHASEKYGSVWALVNPALDVYHYPGDVPLNRRGVARAACLIHSANYWYELLGCIAPGRERGRLPNGEWMVRHSRDAMNILRTMIGTKLDVTLEIRWAEGLSPVALGDT